VAYHFPGVIKRTDNTIYPHGNKNYEAQGAKKGKTTESDPWGFHSATLTV
jgi:hypothetical protein